MKVALYFCAFICGVIFVYELTWLGKGSLAPLFLGLSGSLALVCFHLARKEK